MKLATFNLYQFLEPGHFWYEVSADSCYTDAEWLQKKQWIQQQLATIDADVLGFQEVFSIEPLKKLCQAAGYPHFLTVDQPRTLPDNKTVFNQSVVALASRYPLKPAEPFITSAVVKQDLRLSEHFRFSRLPVCATVDVPQLGNVTVCVVHLKSKRPMSLDWVYLNNLPWRDRSVDTLCSLSRGKVASLIQRGTEATLLYHYACDVITRTERPMVIMGDLNDDIQSSALTALTMQEKVFSIGGIDAEDWPDGVKGHLHDFRLNDSFRIAPDTRQQIRPFTQIHHGKGQTIDYILISNQLNAMNPQAFGEVFKYQVINEHLNADGIENKLKSDHGIVCVEILPIRDTANLPKLSQALPSLSSKPVTRQDFIDLAGGIFQSPQHYRQWSSAEKYERFWCFFFDADYGWVKSVYGQIPLDELRQKELLSIEHLIPLTFLDTYLTNKQAPRYVRYGASGNPFNLAPSERILNAKRSSFPFDMDGDKVVRPSHYALTEHTSHATGLDADNEWVIPLQSRGYVARSILYMLLVYGIDELYQNHIKTLTHWAKIDPASDWEKTYNQWIYNRVGICNPLIDTPAKARELLDNQALMHSMLTTAA